MLGHVWIDKSWFLIDQAMERVGCLICLVVLILRIICAFLFIFERGIHIINLCSLIFFSSYHYTVELKIKNLCHWTLHFPLRFGKRYLVYLEKLRLG